MISSLWLLVFELTRHAPFLGSSTHCSQGLYCSSPRHLHGQLFPPTVPVKGQLLNTLLTNTHYLVATSIPSLYSSTLCFFPLSTYELLTSDMVYFCWEAEIFVFCSLQKSLASRRAPGMQKLLKYLFNVFNKRLWVTHTWQVAPQPSMYHSAQITGVDWLVHEGAPLACGHSLPQVRGGT